MSRRVIVHCDRADCTVHASQAMASTAGFIAVVWHGSTLDYCSVDCLLVGMAAFPGLTTVEEGR